MNPLRSTKFLGIAFLALVLLGVYATYAVFTKKYVDYDEVTLQTSSIGLQLPERADVKIRGVIVGEVLDFDTDAEGASVTLGIFPEDRDLIPEDVTGSILPKTLFGEKFVSLLIPKRPEATQVAAIEPGAVISPTRVSTEVEEVLSDLLPFLEAVQPAELNKTLNAIATALDGRGDQLGNNIETIDAYLKKLNPEIPALVEDLRLTSQTADIYVDILPDLAQILDDTVITTGTLQGREAKLTALFNDVASFSDTTRAFLVQNGDNITRLGELSEAQLRVLSRYSTEFPCLLKGIVKAGALQAEAFRNFTLHIVLETLPRQPRAYNINDKPVYQDDRGPTCLNLPSPPGSQENPVRTQPDFRDGVDEPTGKGTSRPAPGYFFRDGTGYAGSPEETEVIKNLLAPSMGVTPAEVSDLAALLLAPMTRGAEVEYR